LCGVVDVMQLPEEAHHKREIEQGNSLDPSGITFTTSCSDQRPNIFTFQLYLIFSSENVWIISQGDTQE
jgi:hypothetical protein